MTGLLVWMDGEMTGLDTEAERLSSRIVELAVVVTDSDLNLLDAGLDIVVHQPEDVLLASNDFSMKHHTASGLYDQVRVSTVDEAEAQRRVVKYLRSLGVQEGKSPLCGNSIWTDRMFLFTQMPIVNSFLGYQIIDVTSLKLLAKMWHPAVFENKPKKANGHRALEDTLESIEELRYYREEMFVG